MNTRITNFLRYEYIRLEGKYNMITQAEEASADCGLPLQTYAVIQRLYADMKMETELYASKHPDEVREYWEEFGQQLLRQRAKTTAKKLIEEALTVPAPF